MNRRFGIALMLAAWLALCASAGAEGLRIPQWERVRRTLDCDGKTVRIDAVTDVDIPALACEWMAEQPPLDKERLYAFAAAARQADLSLLFDDEEVTLIHEDTGYNATMLHGSLDVRNQSRKSAYSLSLRYVNKKAPFPAIFREEAPCELPGLEYLTLKEALCELPGLGDFTLEEALGRLQPALGLLGVEIGEPSYAAAWDAAALQYSYDRWEYPRKEEKTWQREEAAYQIDFPVYFKGIRLLASGRRLIDERIHYTYSQIRCIITPSETVHLGAEDCLFGVCRPLGEPQPLLTLEEAIDRFRELRCSMSWAFADEEDGLVVDKILLQYAVRKTVRKGYAAYQLTPVWSFYYKTYDNFKDCYDCFNLINAFTGEPFEVFRDSVGGHRLTNEE